jgi:hypothetical protein
MVNCKRCDGPVDEDHIRAELRHRTGDIPETCERAAAASVFCGLTCALEDLAAVND